MTVSNNLTEKELAHYYKDISRALVCKRKTKQKILNGFICGAREYIENNPQADIEALKEHFGTPKAIAEEFAADAGLDYYKREKRRKIFKGIILAAVALILIFTAIICGIIIKNHTMQPIYYTESVIDNGVI